MRTDYLLLALVVGASVWAFRTMPFRFDMSRLSPEGWLSRLLSATGPAAITALFVVSVMPLLGGGQAVPFWAGTLSVIGIWFWRRSVVLATLTGALVYGLAFAI
ncbi:AzlD domain-containing protein [Gemmobacter serpentinus]|uniref:AzlD domain-containing protein n=1 Tax=Gemmobacter serpentinus TaxID=2652247 RepID=UPI00124E770F|nr:AzlD domain-containing protein [Gemmobacter serpentinus]